MVTMIAVMDININDFSNDGDGGGDIDGNSLVASRHPRRLISISGRLRSRPCLQLEHRTDPFHSPFNLLRPSAIVSVTTTVLSIQNKTASNSSFSLWIILMIIIIMNRGVDVS